MTEKWTTQESKGSLIIFIVLFFLLEILVSTVCQYCNATVWSMNSMMLQNNFYEVLVYLTAHDIWAYWASNESPFNHIGTPEH